MHEDDDLALLRRIIAKDRQAFETLYHRYARRLYGYLSKFLRQQEVIEEMLDDVMFVVWQQAAHFDHTSQLSTWIFGIAYHKALKARARAGQLPPALPPATGGAECPGGPGGSHDPAGIASPSGPSSRYPVTTTPGRG